MQAKSKNLYISNFSLMKKFIVQIILFAVIFIALAEVVIRVFHLTIDAPRAYVADNALVKYYPGQEGHFKNEHKWYINKYGYAGNVPASTDNLVVLVGDSFIETFFTPIECHQDSYLKKKLPQYNYLEAGRAGASLVEMFEMSKEADTLNPVLTMIYLSEADMLEGIASINKNDNNVRVDLTNNTIIHQKYKGSALKDLLYDCKVVYYSYRNMIQPYLRSKKKESLLVLDKETPMDKFTGLLNYIKANYSIKNKVLVFRPESDAKVVELCRSLGFNVFYMKTDPTDAKWQIEGDIHWSCYGHDKASTQVKTAIETFMKK